MDNSLTKKERLCGKSLIAGLFNSNNTLFCYPFRCLWSISSLDEDSGSDSSADFIGASVLFSVPKKKIRRANRRNLLKRRMKESYRLNKHSLAEALSLNNRKLHIALLYIATDVVEYNKIEPAIKTLLSQIEKSIK